MNKERGYRWIFIEIIVTIIAVIAIVIWAPEYQRVEKLIHKASPHLRVKMDFGDGLMHVSCLDDKSTPGLWPIAGEIHVVPGVEYSYEVVGFSNDEARLMVASTDGTPLIWPGPFLPMQQDTVRVRFEGKMALKAITIGILFPSPKAGSEFYLRDIKLIEEVRHSLKSGVIALLLMTSIVVFYFTLRQTASL